MHVTSNYTPLYQLKFDVNSWNFYFNRCSFGSFFGPSQPVISQRVIQESKSLLENQHLASRVSDHVHDVSILTSICGSGFNFVYLCV